ncbi:dephospho-CoA kinase [Lagierella sp.]|uniref:dephospho-CoA kinase n=1 Tax=Lagierella sp. TaxID=2849657 RepID=UPI00261F64A6|nr:dephospho-CoA kinase [Lagierella sp.]
MSLNNRIFVITGGISSGKSSVMKIIEKRGFKTYSSDKIVHNLYEDRYMKESIKEIFPEEEIFNLDGSLNRKKLGEIVFSDTKRRVELEKLVHPMVVNKIISTVKKSENESLFFEIPLYSKVEDILLNSLDYDIISVDCNRDIQLKRLQERQRITLEEAEKIILVNDTWRKFKKVPLRIIWNNGTIEELQEKVELFLIEENLI